MGKALILDSSVSGGAASTEAVEAGLAGFTTVDVVSDATWAAMTAAQFADYQVVIVGDPTCGVLPAVVGANRVNLSDAVMARAGGNTKVGNRIVIGTDPQFHVNAGTTGDGGRKVIETGIRFAGVQPDATGLYLDTTCGDPDYDGNGVGDGVDLLGLLTAATNNWTNSPAATCGGAASLISNAAQFATLTSAHLQGWFCSVHTTYPTFPTDWSPLALATDSATTPVCGTDVDTGATVCGEAYILIAGSGIVTVAPNLALTPATATNPVGTTHTVTAKVTNPDGTPRSGVLVEFVVTGANAGASGTCVPASCVTDANGEVTFTYTGANVGTDTINAAITVDGSRQTATAGKTWEDVAPPDHHVPPPPPIFHHFKVVCEGPHGVLAEGAAVWRTGTIHCTFDGGPVTWSASGFSLGAPNGGSSMTFNALGIFGPASVTATPATGPSVTMTFVIV